MEKFYFIILILTLLFINGCASESGITSGVKRTPGGETVQLRETDNLTEAEKNKLRQNLIKEVREGFTFYRLSPGDMLEVMYHLSLVSEAQDYRIGVNDELNVFDIALKDALDLLNLNGRISVITFHSLEDKICKYTFNEVSKLKDVPKGLPIIPLEMQPKFKLVNRKPIIASDDELTHNHRAHSAKLRVIERVIL